MNLTSAQTIKEISLVREYLQNLIRESATENIDVRNEIKVDMPLNLTAEGAVTYQALPQRQRNNDITYMGYISTL